MGRPAKNKVQNPQPTVPIVEEEVKLEPEVPIVEPFVATITLATTDPFGEKYFKDLILKGNDVFKKGGWQKVYAYYLEKVFGLRGKAVLDIGCAAGSIASAIADYGNKVYGNDISEYIAKHTPFKNFEFVNSPAWDLKQIPDNSIDLVISMYSFQFIPKNRLDSVFSEIKRVCKNNANIFIITNLGSSHSEVGYETIHTKSILDESASRFGMIDVAKSFYQKLMSTVVPGWDFMRKYKWPYVVYKVEK